MDTINLVEKLARFGEYWKPKIVGELNDCWIKVAKFKGEFVWHAHPGDDELFLVVSGRMTLKLRDRDVVVGPGELVVVPAGVEHCPVAADEVHALLIERKSVVNTGDAGGERTVPTLERI